MSNSLKSLLTGLFQKNPTERLGNNIADLKQHPWFSNVNWQKIV